ncbi:MAG: sigma-70 family RNA polymerase sigma factor [Planctomycetes bacterium]|nr:sigma-70 family RNA polymerase sigma factor [Planctomycetota bacterium]
MSELIESAQAGGEQAAEELFPLLYGELRDLARQMIARERPGQTLQPTALVHEAYLRIVGGRDRGWDGRPHLFAAVAEAMRRILINRARRKGRIKHGGDHERVELDLTDLPIEAPSEDILQVEEALASLEAAYPQARAIVNLRYFAGFTNQETADALGMSDATVRREWRFIHAWLRDALGPVGPE